MSESFNNNISKTIFPILNNRVKFSTSTHKFNRLLSIKNPVLHACFEYVLYTNTIKIRFSFANLITKDKITKLKKKS